MSGPPLPLWDEGLQLERTALAWRRTGLALAVASAAAGRLLLDVLGLAAVPLGLLGAAAAAAVMLAAQRRYTRAHRALLRENGGARWPYGGVVPALTVAVTLLLGLAATAVVLAGTARIAHPG